MVLRQRGVSNHVDMIYAVDLNRVGTALNYLRDRLTGVCGRDITWQAKTEKR